MIGQWAAGCAASSNLHDFAANLALRPYFLGGLNMDEYQEELLDTRADERDLPELAEDATEL